jgi:hypothetical protein
MTREEALTFHRELEELVPMGPGWLADAKARLARIRAAFDGNPDAGVYLDEKVHDACEFLGIWLSQRRWRKWGRDPSRLRGIVNNCVGGVRRAIDTQFPESPGDSGAGAANRASESRPSARRLQLVFNYRTEARDAYRRAVEAGIEQPVVMLVDPQDLAGRALLDVVNPVPGQSPARENEPCFVLVPLAHLRGSESLLRPAWRMSLENLLEHYGSPEVHVIIVIAYGGCLCQTMPLNLG